MVYIPSYIALIFFLSTVTHGLAFTKRAPTTIQNTFAGILPRARAFNTAASKLSFSMTTAQYWDFLGVAQELTKFDTKDAFLGALNQPTLTDAEVSKLLPVVKGTVDELVSGMDRLTSHIDDFWAIPAEDDLCLIVSSTRYHISAIRWDIDSYFRIILESYPRIPASSKALIQEQATRHYDKLWSVDYTWWNAKRLPVATNRTTPAVESWKNRILADLERRVARSADFKEYISSLTADASEEHYLLTLDLENQVLLPGVNIETWQEFNKFDGQTAQEALDLSKAFSSNIIEGHSALTTKWDLFKDKPWARYLRLLLSYDTEDGSRFSDYIDNVGRLSPSSYGDFNALNSAVRSKWSSISGFWYSVA